MLRAQRLGCTDPLTLNAHSGSAFNIEAVPLPQKNSLCPGWAVLDGLFEFYPSEVITLGVRLADVEANVQVGQSPVPDSVRGDKTRGSASLSELLRHSLTRYRNRAVETAQVIVDLIERAFYDALATNEAAVRELGDETLKKIAVELVVKLRGSVTVDWAKRETVRARLRVMVKTCLNATSIRRGRRRRRRTPS